MSVLLTRPLADSQRFAERLRKDGIDSVLAPLLEIRPLALAPLDLDGVQAILLTSANGAQALAGLTERRDIRILAVGPATAQQARQDGFADVAVAGGDAIRLAELACATLSPEAGRLIHVAGSVQAGDLAGALSAQGFSVERLIAYHAETAQTLPAAAARALESGLLTAAAFFSPRTAATFATLVTQAGLAGTTAPLAVFCLSRAVADALGCLEWRATCVPREPEGELLARLIRSSLEMS